MAEQYDRICEHSVIIASDPGRVLAAFFSPKALQAWWQTVRSVTLPRPLGVYAVEWEQTPHRDELLGPLGGVFHGTVIDFRPARSFFVADAYWVPHDGDPIGPMALDVTCRREGRWTRLRVRQSGAGDGERWARYYEIISAGWTASLAALKKYLEDPSSTQPL